MPDPAEIIVFAAEPLDRASGARTDPEWLATRLADPASLIIPLYRGDPLIREGKAAFLAADARREFDAGATVVFLGLKGPRAYFAIDASGAPGPGQAPFADLGAYTPLREAAGALSGEDIAVIGAARWLIDWHRRHAHCAHCGAKTEMKDGGARRLCQQCGTEHFPRTDPVAIVLAVHDDACLLARGPRFPPGFLSALAGFVEACETPEACAVRELKEEAGVALTNVRYQFSQPWPFPSSLMMGFIADAKDKELKLDEKEIVEARWMSRDEIRRLLAGERREDVRLPPRFTIARRLIERWAAD
ncbi:MAG: NAD(+) diphosphatase [Parvularculaceae bacterium]|nr:NAD(+) diphosphatase [Parvularculaceae bacterium]